MRLEDIDATRCRPDYADAIQEDLAWLGIDWDGPVRVQSAHLDDYAAVLTNLRARNLLYPCFCTRADIARETAASAAAPHGPDGAPLYPGTCRGLSRTDSEQRIEYGSPYAWRLDIARALGEIHRPITYDEQDGEGWHNTVCDPARFGDIVLARKDVPAGYHLCVTHDDALQGVTMVTRGLDLQHATDPQRLLQLLMSWPAPRYAHHRLLTDASGRRFAKRDRSLTLRALRDAGKSPEEVRLMSGFTQ